MDSLAQGEHCEGKEATSLEKGNVENKDGKNIKPSIKTLVNKYILCR